MTNEAIQEKKEEDKLPHELEKDIDEKTIMVENKLDAIGKVDLKSILKLDDEREIIKRIRDLPVLTEIDHKHLDQLDTSKFRLWMMRQSEKDEWEVKTKKVKSIDKDTGEVEYELEEGSKVPKIEPLLIFYSPLTNHQKKTLRRLESVTTHSAIAYNNANMECVKLSLDKKTDTPEYWKAIEERDRLQTLYFTNNDISSKKNAEFRLGIKPSEYDHILEQDLLRYVAVALYKENLKNQE